MRTALNLPVGILGEEEPIKCRLAFVGWVATETFIRLDLQLFDCIIVIDHGGVLNHGCLWFEVWTLVLTVFHLCIISHNSSHYYTCDKAGEERPLSEMVPSGGFMVHIYEFVTPSWHWYGWHTRYSSLHPVAYSGCERPSEKCSNDPPLEELKSILTNELALVVVRYSFRTECLFLP